MALVNLTEILADANAKKYAVGNFDVFNIEMAAGVLKAAEETKSPIIYAFGEGFTSVSPLFPFTAAVRCMAERASVPVCIHLDHATNVDFLFQCVEAGFTSVMIDMSDKSFEENIAITKEVTEKCHAQNVSVEAELGHVSGLGDLYGDDTEVYTKVEDAVKFVDATGIDALAIAIGTVHGNGAIKGKPQLNIQRCRDIKAATNYMPLVLHGASGLTDEDFANVIDAGINKVNIYTDLTLTAAAKMDAARAAGKIAYVDLAAEAEQGVYEETLKKLAIFGCMGKA